MTPGRLRTRSAPFSEEMEELSYSCFFVAMYFSLTVHKMWKRLLWRITIHYNFTLKIHFRQGKGAKGARGGKVPCVRGGIVIKWACDTVHIASWKDYIGKNVVFANHILSRSELCRNRRRGCVFRCVALPRTFFADGASIRKKFTPYIWGRTVSHKNRNRKVWTG